MNQNYPIGYIECDRTRIESVENFIEDLIQKINIPVDIYDKITDIKNKIVFVPFYRANVEYDCDYSGTACWDRQEPYQDWETYTEYHDGKSYQKQRQVTKYRRVTDRRPFNGNFSDKCSNNESMSIEYGDFMSKLDLTKRLNGLKPLVVDDNFTIEGIDVERNEIASIENAKRIATHHTGEIAHSEAKYKVLLRKQGEYSENLRWTIDVKKVTDLVIYIPIQKITFSYNGEQYFKYNAISDTFSDSYENLPTQDYDTVEFVAKETKSIQELKTNIENKNKIKRNKYIYKGWFFIIIVAIYVYILLNCYINSDFVYNNRIVLSSIIGLLGAIGTGYFLFKERKICKIQNDVINFQTNEINDFSILKEEIEEIKKEKITNFMEKSKETFLEQFKEKHENTMCDDNKTWNLTFDERNTDTEHDDESDYDTSIHVNETNEKNNKTIDRFNLIFALIFVIGLLPIAYICFTVYQKSVTGYGGGNIKNQSNKVIEYRWNNESDKTNQKNSSTEKNNAQNTYKNTKIENDEYKNNNDIVNTDDNNLKQTTQTNNDEYILPDSSTRLLEYSDIAGLSQEKLNLAVNEIYARHGRLFKKPEIQNYFNSKSWYHGYISPSNFNGESLSTIENANITLIKSYIK